MKPRAKQLTSSYYRITKEMMRALSSQSSFTSCGAPSCSYSSSSSSSALLRRGSNNTTVVHRRRFPLSFFLHHHRGFRVFASPQQQQQRQEKSTPAGGEKNEAFGEEELPELLEELERFNYVGAQFVRSNGKAVRNLSSKNGTAKKSQEKNKMALESESAPCRASERWISRTE